MYEKRVQTQNSSCGHEVQVQNTRRALLSFQVMCEKRKLRTAFVLVFCSHVFDFSFIYFFIARILALLRFKIASFYHKTQIYLIILIIPKSLLYYAIVCSYSKVTKVYSKISSLKSSENDFILLPASYLIMCLMKALKIFLKIVIFKIRKLVSF